MLTNLIIAHRGIHNNDDIPENTILAFSKAIEKNIPIEFDIQITKDNKLIVFHDENINRLTNIDKNIQDMTYDEIKKIKLLNTNEKIPTLKEVLKLVDGKVLIDIEIKNTKKKKELTNLLLKELGDYNGDVIIKSFYPSFIRRIRKKTNKYKVGLLLTNNSKKKFFNYLANTNFVLKIYKPDFVSISKKMLIKKYLKKYKDKYPILVWTIKDEKIEDYKKKYLNYSFICNIK